MMTEPYRAQYGVCIVAALDGADDAGGCEDGENVFRHEAPVVAVAVVGTGYRKPTGATPKPYKSGWLIKSHALRRR